MTLRFLAIGCVAAVLGSSGQPSLVVLSAADRPAQPRVAPLADSALTSAHRAALAAVGREVSGLQNDLRTWLNHPELVKGVVPFADYISTGSSLTVRDRELLILRTAALARSEYVWAHHVGSARAAGLDAAAVRRIASEPPAAPWSAADIALLSAADELHRNAFISTPTWTALSTRYDTTHLLDIVFTVTEFTMLAGAFNSLGVPLENEMRDRLPAKVIATAPAPREPALTRARVPPLESSEWTPTVRAMLDPGGTGRNVIAIYRTIARHEKLYPPRQVLSEYIRLHSTLSARQRELLILRTGWLAQSEYEWAQHVRAGRNAGLDTERVAIGTAAPGWNAIDRALIDAADELYRDDLIATPTWQRLSAELSPAQMMDVLITAGGYRMVSMALNTLGVQLEPGNERFPAVDRPK